MSLHRKRVVLAAVTGAGVLGVAGFGLGVASAGSSNPPSSLDAADAPSSGSAALPAGRNMDTAAQNDPVDQLAEMQPFLTCLSDMGVPVPDMNADKLSIEITRSAAGLPEITLNGEPLDLSAAGNAALACRGELPALDGMLSDGVIPQDVLEELGGGDWMAKLEEFQACMTQAEDSGNTDALLTCAMALHD